VKLDFIHLECLSKYEGWNLRHLYGIPYLELKHPSGVCITIEERPSYCDRGNYIAKISSTGSLWIDDADGWPRYYFDLNVALSEIDAFLKRRSELKP